MRRDPCHEQRQRHEQSTPTQCDLLEIDNLGKRFGGFVALENISLSVAGGRASRPDRAERLRQEHAGQLHLRHAAQRARRRALRRPQARRACRASAHPSRTGAQLSAAAAVRQPQPDRQYPHPAALHRGGARQPAHRATRSRSAAPICCAKSASKPRRGSCRAISPSAKCASSNWRAPWRRSRSS